jgi:hypothetical protein
VTAWAYTSETCITQTTCSVVSVCIDLCFCQDKVTAKSKYTKTHLHFLHFQKHALRRKITALVISALERLKQEDCEFEASLGYRVRDPVSKRKKRGKGESGKKEE